MGKISRDTPLAEITLRKYEPPAMKGRELIRKLCLSLGLLQPGDSRDVMVDVLHIMLKHKQLSSKEIEEEVISQRKKMGLPMLGIAPSNIRRQLLRLRELFILEKDGNNYRITENQTLSEIFSEKIESYYLNSIVKRVREYIKEVDRQYESSKQ